MTIYQRRFLVRKSRKSPLGDIDPAFKKVDFEGGTLRQVVLYNPETKETLRVTVDDAEYPPRRKSFPQVSSRGIGEISKGTN